MGYDITHPSQLAAKKVLAADWGDNLPSGTPIELFDLTEPHPEFNVDKEMIWEELKESCNNPDANMRVDHFEQTLRQFAKICLEAPVKL
jgi:rubredoxin